MNQKLLLFVLALLGVACRSPTHHTVVGIYEVDENPDALLAVSVAVDATFTRSIPSST
jgi:hypothetical protein